MTKLEHALDLAAKGFYVFPLIENGKLPLIERWPSKATRDADQIRKWWTCDIMETEHDYNIGIFTGRFGDDQALLVVDVDNKNGKCGDDELFNLELQGFDLPTTITQTTPTGGRHLIFVVDQPVKQGANVLAPGLDIRSAGGFIVGAGSEIDGAAYLMTGLPDKRAGG